MPSREEAKRDFRAGITRIAGGPVEWVPIGEQTLIGSKEAVAKTLKLRPGKYKIMIVKPQETNQ